MQKTKLFLLHFAGGNCYSYQFLQPELSKSFDVVVLELPGRGKRMGEPLIKAMDVAVKDLLKQVLPHLNSTDGFMIFGHSLGATLAWLLTLKLERMGYYPDQLIVSGNPGPNVGETKGMSRMSQPDLIQELRKMGGVSDELFAHKELFEFFEPALRADFALSECRFDMSTDQRVETPLYAIMGDIEDDVAHIQNWGQYCQEFDYAIMEGDHFFIHQQKQSLIKLFRGLDRQYALKSSQVPMYRSKWANEEVEVMLQ